MTVKSFVPLKSMIEFSDSNITVSPTNLQREQRNESTSKPGKKKKKKCWNLSVAFLPNRTTNRTSRLSISLLTATSRWKRVVLHLHRIPVWANRAAVVWPSPGPACKYLSFPASWRAPLPLLWKTSLLLSSFFPLPHWGERFVAWWKCKSRWLHPYVTAENGLKWPHWVRYEKNFENTCISLMAVCSYIFCLRVSLCSW